MYGQFYGKGAGLQIVSNWAAMRRPHGKNAILIGSASTLLRVYGLKGDMGFRVPLKGYMGIMEKKMEATV